MKYLNLCLVLFLCLTCSSLFAQTPKQIEADLLKSLKRIGYWFQKTNGTAATTLSANDSLENANDVFAKKLKHYTEKFPSTITYSFALLQKENLDISTSSDGLFRIYSWDTWTGGTMHFFENVMQYKSGAGFKAIIDTPKSEGDNRPGYREIYTFKANGKTYYITVYLFIGSTIDISQGVHVFTIENNKLVAAKIIKTRSGLHSDLSYDEKVNGNGEPQIRFDNATSTLYIPLIGSNYMPTNKFILYKFTGQYFERVKN